MTTASMRALRSLIVLGLATLTAACAARVRRGTTGGDPARAAVDLEPPPEDESGLVGAPIDETAFDFTPEEGGRAHSFTLDGTDDVPEAIIEALAPYLEVRRVKLASLGPEGPPLLVVSRLGETAQAYQVHTPLGARKQLTFGDDAVEQAGFIPGDQTQLLFRRDQGGDELFQVFLTRLGTGRASRLTDGRSRHGAFRLSPSRRLFLSRDGPRPQDTTILVQDQIGLGPPRPVKTLSGMWLLATPSPDGRRVLAREFRSASQSVFHILDVETGALTPLEPLTPGLIHRDARFSSDGRRVYVVTNHGGGDTLALWEPELESQAWTLLTPGLGWDVEAIARSSDDQRIVVVLNEDGLSTLHLLALETRQLAPLEGAPRGGLITTPMFSTSGEVLAMGFETATRPADAYTFHLGRRELLRWTESETGGLDPERFVAPELIRVESFDGLPVPAYLYRPPGEGPHPVLLWMHGGPEEQFRPGFNPIIQFLALELGLAILAPNIRGSEGYGVRYLGLDDGRNREDSIRDVGALLDWIEGQGELDASRVGIFGASYGGYAVLASLIHYGDRLLAGCDMVGVSSFVTFLENTANYRRDSRRVEYGDERDEEMREFLEGISPLRRAGEIRSALFVAHGANDPRVPAGEAAQIVEAVRAVGGEAWFALASDEGHGFHRRANRDLFYQLMATFFTNHLLEEAASPAPAEQTAGDDLDEEALGDDALGDEP